MQDLSPASLKHSEETRVPLHQPQDFAHMRQAGQLAAQTLDHIAPFVQPGITTAELDRICDRFIRDHGAIPAPLGYRGYPKSICTSINHVVCHGIPSDRKTLRDGDILNIDVTVILDGWYGDSSRMYAAGQPGVKARKLCALTWQVLEEAIRIVRPGITTGDIGHTIQRHAEEAGYGVVRDFCGHGLGQKFHQPPSILHYGQPDTGLVLKPGMFFTIEPMINAGGWKILVLRDGWTAITRDRSLSAQYEHSIGVTTDGCEVFTRSPAGLDQVPLAAAG